MRRDVAAHVRRDVRVVDEPLLLVTAQVGHAHEVEATPEAREFGVLAERVEVQLVGAPGHDAIELHVLRGEGDLSRFDGKLEVLERVERPLEEIADSRSPPAASMSSPLARRG